MRELDETDLEILQLLVEDARRPYNEIAEQVGVSPPTVSDRIERLQELGVIRQFTLDMDRSLLAEGVSVLVDLHVRPGRVAEVREQIASVDGVEHVFITADARIVLQASVRENDIEGLLSNAIDSTAVREYDVHLLVDSVWNPQPKNVQFALECDECGNTVTSEGETVRIDGELHQFCCSSCEANFRERYERLQESAT